MNESEKHLYNLIHDELLATHMDKATFLKKVSDIYDKVQADIDESQYKFIQKELSNVLETVIAAYYPADMRQEMWDVFCKSGGMSLLEDVVSIIKDELLDSLHEKVVEFRNSRSPTGSKEKPSDEKEKEKTFPSSFDEWKWKLVDDSFLGATSYIDKLYIGGKLVYDSDADAKEAEKKKANAPKKSK